MKRKQTRYTTEKQILDRIDELTNRSDELLQEALKEDMAAGVALEQIKKLSMEVDRLNEAGRRKEAGDVGMQINKLQFERKQCQERSAKANKSRNTIKDCTLPRMGQVLAAFRTEPMCFCGNDKGVVA